MPGSAPDGRAGQDRPRTLRSRNHGGRGLAQQPELAIDAARQWLTGLSGWRRWLAATVAGATSILAMAPFFLWPVLFVTLPALIWMIEARPGGTPRAEGAGPADPEPVSFMLDRRRLLGAAAIGWCFGFGFHVVGLYWLREAFLVTGGGLAWLWPLGVVGLPAYLALYHGLAAAVTATVRGPAVLRALALAVALAGTEWLRGHAFTGFPWNIIGLAFTWPLALMQSASLVGIYGLSLIVVFVCAAPGVMLMDAGGGQRARRWAAALVAGLPLVAMGTFGAWRLSATPPAMVDGVRLRLVQPSIPQRDKWLPEKQLEFVHRHLELSMRNAAGVTDNLAGITHVIWPEAAMPFLPLQRPNVISTLSDALPQGVHVLAGILRLERGSGNEVAIFNSLAALDDMARPVAMYDKIHLVPFGEYLPFSEWLEAIGLQALTRQRGGFAIGVVPRPLLRVPGLPPVGPLICYEGVFPAAVVQGAERPSVLLNVTNDGWFGNSTGPRQHLHQVRLRTVEEGLPLLRVANNGISAVYDAYGRELARLGLDAAGVIDTGLPGAIAAPLYALFGDAVFLGLWLAALSALIIAVRRGARE